MNARVLAESGWPCPTGAEMADIDRVAIERLGLPGRVLMETAGRAVARALRRHRPQARRPLVVCGAGNNGGDGFVIARSLCDWDDRVRPVAAVFGERDRYSPEARENLELLMKSGAEVLFPERGKDLRPLLEHADVAIDALFGVGLARAVEGERLHALEALAESPCELVCVDVPSGLCSDTGQWLGPELAPRLVVTLGLPKLGLALRPLDASIRVADIGIPAGALEAVPVHQWLWTPAAARARLPGRPLGGHKGSFGHVFLVAGSEGKTGAACLAAEGALRAGAGLVTAAVPRALSAVFEVKLTEAMTLPVADSGTGAFLPEALEGLVRAAGARDVLVVGPGIGQRDASLELVRRLLGTVRLPAVVDADGLNAFAGRPEELQGPGSRILTPHPGEMARLLGRSRAEVQADRVGAARELAERAGAVVVHKGARTVIAAPDGEARINPTGGPALASGGSGDVLAGVVAALVASGAPSFDAASLAAYLHGLAGDSFGRVGAVAGDLAARLPETWRRLAAPPDPEDEPDTLLRFP